MAIWSSGAPRITQLSDAPRRSHDFTLTVLKSGTMKSRIIGTPSCSTHCSNAVFPLYGFASNMNPRQASFPTEPPSIRAALACIFPFRLQLHDEIGHTLFSIDHGRILQVDIFLFQFVRIHFSHRRILIFEFDHVTARFRAFEHPLPAANRILLAPTLQRQLANRLFPQIEMLMKPSVRRGHHAERTPVKSLPVLPLRPHQGIAPSPESNDVGPWTVAVRLFIDPYGRLTDVTRQSIAGKLDLDMFHARSLGGKLVEREIHNVRDKIAFPHVSGMSFSLSGKIFPLIIESLFEPVRVFHNEIVAMKHIEDRRSVGHGHVTNGFRSGAVEMLMPNIERRRKQAAALPLEGCRFRAVPYRRCPAAAQNKYQLFEQMPLRLGRFSSTDLANIGRHAELIFRRTEHKPAPRGSDPIPRFERQQIQIGHNEVPNHRNAFILYPLFERSLPRVWLRFKCAFHRSLFSAAQFPGHLYSASMNPPLSASLRYE